MTEPLSDERLAKIRADIALSTQGPPRQQRFEAWTRLADTHAETLLDEVERLRAELAEEEYVSAERGRYLAQVDAALDAAGQDEGGGYIAYARRITEVAAERDRLRAADTAVLAVMAHYRDAPDDASRWAILSDLAIARAINATAGGQP